MAQRAHRHDPDPFTPEGTISPDEIYTRSTDQKGHFREIRVLVPPELHAQLHQIAHDPRLPGYRSAADFARDALVQRGAYWADHLEDPELLRVVSAEAIRCRAERIAVEMDTWEEIIAKFQASYDRARTHGSDFKMNEVVLEIERTLNQQTVDPAFAGQLRRIVDDHARRRA